MYTDDAIREIVSSWDLKIGRSRPDIDIAGSPERTEYRVVVEDEEHALWVLEGVCPDSYEHKLLICRTLAFLHGKGLEGAFPIVFCHGDFHPLNVVWSEDGIKSVIDWEFLGCKPEVYDVANLIGCVGFEDPAGLTEGLIAELISRMMKANVLSPVCWQHLAEWVIAIRFAWLSDWLRRRDREMIDLEVTYIHLLIDNRQNLKDFWGKPD